MKKLQKRSDRRRRIRGQGMAEYGILVAVIAVLSIAIVTQFGDQIRDLFFGTGTALAEGDDSIETTNRMNEDDVTKSLGGN